MKKLFGCLTLPILICCIQACSNNSESKSAATDSVATTSSSNDSVINENEPANTDSSKKGNVVRIDATDVPNAVVTAFNSKYPNIADVKWQKGDNKKGKTFYKAQWQANGKKIMAMFANNGSFIKEKQLN